MYSWMRAFISRYIVYSGVGRPGERWSEKDAKVAERRHMVKGRVGNGGNGGKT